MRRRSLLSRERERLDTSIRLVRVSARELAVVNPKEGKKRKKKHRRPLLPSLLPFEPPPPGQSSLSFFLSFLRPFFLRLFLLT